ncbi:MAG: pyruvate kinase [Solirubrobacteraceae bacterium]
MARRTKIVATIGPASREPEVLRRLIEAGLDVARFNFSHGSRELHAENAERVRTASEAVGRQIAILQDLPGPKLRIGALRDGIAELKPGEKLLLNCGSTEEGDHTHMSVSWAGLVEAVDPDDVIYLADGAIRLRVDAIRLGEGEIDTAVEVGGTVATRQGLNIPGSTRGLAAVPAEDLDMLHFGESIGVDAVALSFVREPSDVLEVRKHTRLPLIAKIEKPQAVENHVEIIRAADVVMVARGDLGIELPIQEVPIVQKRLLRTAGTLARPSITATQMLDSMVNSSRPTRAEATDVANAILDGTDAVMLSQETAVGSYPVEAVAMMASIAEHTERSLPYDRWNEERVRRDARDPAYTIAYSACAAARDLGLAALVIPTLSGRSVRLISQHRPNVPIYCLSPGHETIRRCNLMWGVESAFLPRYEVTEEIIAAAAERAVELGWVRRGERIGITAGLPSGAPGTTSLFQVQTV